MLKEITPPTTFANVCADRRLAAARVLAVELQHVAITNLAVTPQQVTKDTGLAVLLGLVGVPPRILVQPFDCESQRVLKNVAQLPNP